MVEKFFDVLKNIDNFDKKGPNIKEHTVDKKDIQLNYDPIINKDNGGRSFLPKNDGIWSGERGDSLWQPDKDKIPTGKDTNFDNLSWGELLDKYQIDGVQFNDGEPNFEGVAKETVEIDDFTDKRSKNFMQADIKAADKMGCTPEEVRKFRQENKYTWHERSDCKTMDLVPSEIHNNIPHSGGISEKKKENV
ncbi:HNH endonuclease [Cetobacterium somerae]